MIFIRKIFIYIFLSISTFFVIGAFTSKAYNKPTISFSYVLNELKVANIGFDIKNDIEELSDAMNNLSNIDNSNSDKVLQVVKNIAKTIYFMSRFFIKLIIHSLVAILNVIILILRCVGLVNMNYIHLTTGKYVGASGLVPTVTPGGFGWS